MTHRFFGYGSLVNLATHTNTDPQPARLAGWRRVWRHVETYDCAVLSVEPADGELLGLSAVVPNGDWGALDARERGYERRMVTLDRQSDSAVYVVTPFTDQTPPPIQLSYLDVICQGYLHQFNAAAVAEFFATTANWTDILDDRHAPRYPRHQVLAPDERDLVDQHISQLGVTIIKAP